MISAGRGELQHFTRGGEERRGDNINLDYQSVPVTI